MSLEQSLLLVGGLVHAGVAVFHLMFARLLRWDKELVKLDFINRPLLPVMNNFLIALFIGVFVLSFVYSRDLLASSLGHALLLAIALLWSWRALLQVVYYRLQHRASWLLFLVFVGMAMLYGSIWIMVV